MELFVLASCGHWNMIDAENLERRPLSGLYTAEGFTCQECNTWKPWWYSTRQLDENMRKLETMKPDHPSFWWHFVKTRKRAEEIQQRGRNTAHGEIGHQNMATPG
jgi:hypothetical protein